MRVNAKTTRSGKTTKKATTRTRKGAPRKRRNSGAKGDLRQQAVRVNKLEACMVSMAEMLKSRAQPLDFVIPTVVRGTVTALVGPGGVGKSGFALQTAISVAIGRDAYNLWGDPDAPVAIKKGKVLYISAEDSKDVVTNRVKVACKKLTRAQRRNAIENLQWFFPEGFGIVKRSNGQLVESDWITDLHEFLRKMPEKPRLIIIDTLNRSLGDANENSATGIGKLEGALKGVAEAWNAAVQIVHHTAKNVGDVEAGLKADAARGSGATAANVRSMINIVPDDKNPDVICFGASKVNYGPKPPMRYAKRDNNGVLTGSSVHPDSISTARHSLQPQTSKMEGERSVLGSKAKAIRSKTSGRVPESPPSKMLN